MNRLVARAFMIVLSVSIACAASCAKDARSSEEDAAIGGDEDANTAGTAGEDNPAGSSGGGASGSQRPAAGRGGASGAAGRGGSTAAGSGGAGAGAAGRGGAAGGGGNCTVQGLSAGDTTRMLSYGGANRRYLVHVPPNYDATTLVPLVIDLHGWTYTDANQAAVSGWRDKSDQEGFIVVHPNGLDTSWNGGALCCGSSQENGVDDEGFIRSLVTQLSREVCVDPKRIYATGLSNGGALSYALACHSANLFAAVAPVSMGNGTSPCSPSRPISMIMFRGTGDDLVPYTSGAMYPSAAEDLAEWKSLNSCTGTPSKVNGVCDRYSGCAGGSEVMLCTIPDGEHVLYDDAAAAGAAVPDVAWAAFARHTLP